MDKKQLTEQEVRTRFITPAIKSSGWSTIQLREEYAITKGRIIARGGTYKRDKAKFADYVLFYKPHIPLAIVEAKDNNHTHGDGMQQALDYAQRLMVPFVFTSNGDCFVFHNRLSSSDTKEIILHLDKFPSPETLWEMYKSAANLDEQQEKIAVQPYHMEREEKEARYYQLNAINMTVNAIAKGQNRALLVMATGTGKTYTAFQIIWRLWKSGVKKRILFLADRNALIDQTYINDFAPFKDKMTIVRNRKVDKSYEVYLALYQGLTGEGDKEIFKQFSSGFFDLIVVDECHRGSAKADSEWREILQYFGAAAQIGLTATPKEDKDVSNIDYFGDPIYVYSLKQGIDDGFLAPYRVIRVLLDKDAEGFRPYVGQTDRFGKEIVDREYNTRDYDRELVLEQRTKMVAKVVSNYLKKHDTRYDKTIFFCVDTDHADRMRQALINENSDLVTADERYVMRITGDDDIGKKQLDNFRDVSSKYPVLVTTSKLLTTGVDVQMVKNIVLDAHINSMTEFKQIIGRGTRVREDLGKMFFTIFDFRDATRLFADPDFDGPCEQDDAFTPSPDGELPSPPEPPVDEPGEGENPEPPGTGSDGPRPEGRMKYYVHDVEVTVLKQRVQYIDKDGKLITESLTDYTRRNLRDQFVTLEAFLAAWNTAKRKQAVLDELASQGVLIEELQEQIGHEFDPFDLLCHIAYDKPPLTRQERANNVKKRNYFAKYGEQAAVILDALLEKYADSGILSLESMDILKVNPIRNFGSPLHIVNGIFKGKANFESALHELAQELYAA
ncbi:EcoAI/FtnUII family type I restriction enzme subunit R [Desulfovibrio cuneatus]|uniref:EcoAI/FtnUII family type I restriction enzme subunit R n=1 Tax=Desulfovibrio cuneatus TaxID=159728 RepID=UPI00041ACE0C|nr:DEAD/DEAH box helicase family protein [Desulfovibrio cuneatus]